MMNEREVLTRFEQELQQYCNNDVTVLKQVDITSDMISVDAVIDYHGMIVAVIECVRDENYLAAVRRDISKIMKRAQVQLGIVITLAGKYYIRKISNTRSSAATIERIASEIKSIYSEIRETLSPQEVKTALLSLFEKAPKFSRKEIIRPLFEKACDSLHIASGRISFDERDEDEIFQLILGDKLPQDCHICRYTTLDSLFKMIDSCKHAMCSPISMNDPDEGEYADRFMPWHVKRARGEAEIDIDNSYFLLSCSEIDKLDDLTMWRLYGDKTKGVCIEYAIESDKVDNKKYILSRVSYGQQDKNGKEFHPELDFISYLQSKAISFGWYFSFAKWYIWKFFFKSWNYRDENEIRLVYIPDNSIDEEYNRIKWYKDYTNGIINRMTLIPIGLGKRTDFPLNINRIVLGPHSPEAGRNREQIWFMMSQKAIDTTRDFIVEKSTIRNYR